MGGIASVLGKATKHEGMDTGVTHDARVTGVLRDEVPVPLGVGLAIDIEGAIEHEVENVALVSVALDDLPGSHLGLVKESHVTHFHEELEVVDLVVAEPHHVLIAHLHL